MNLLGRIFLNSRNFVKTERCNYGDVEELTFLIMKSEGSFKRRRKDRKNREREMKRE